jgi:hypothetical protein
MTVRANFDYAATSIAHFTIIGCSACSRCLRQVSIAGLSRPPDKAHVLLEPLCAGHALYRPTADPLAKYPSTPLIRSVNVKDVLGDVQTDYDSL